MGLAMPFWNKITPESQLSDLSDIPSARFEYDRDELVLLLPENARLLFHTDKPSGPGSSHVDRLKCIDNVRIIERTFELYSQWNMDGHILDHLKFAAEAEFLIYSRMVQLGQARVTQSLRKRFAR